MYAKATENKCFVLSSFHILKHVFICFEVSKYIETFSKNDRVLFGKW